MAEIVRRMPWPAESRAESEPLLMREWLVTNGLGGYASGTVSGAVTRRFHGLLIAALHTPFGRLMMLNHLSEEISLSSGNSVRLGGQERKGQQPEIHGAAHLAEFRLEAGMPVWRYEVDGIVIEKQLLITYLQNTVYVTYRLLSGDGSIKLSLRPSMQFRAHESRVDTPITEPYQLTISGDHYEITGNPNLPSLRLYLYGDNTSLISDQGIVKDVYYRIEDRRGYDSQGELWSPGYFTTTLIPGRETTFVASTEAWATILALSPAEALDAERERRSLLLAKAPETAQAGTAAELVLAADQFIITPSGRVEDIARARAMGDEIRTVIAGYHWFTDWGRDTMISLEGLTLSTGRHIEAGWILRTFAHYVRAGLIPNMFPEGENQGLYHTADATLWFFHALSRYVEITGDNATLRSILPKLREIVDFHLQGTLFGIGVDPQDGLLKQGAEGYQLTWMDAKVGDWVVTPRRGKAVEINALWYNALSLLANWLREEDDVEASALIEGHAARVRQSFNERFWFEAGGYLYDIIDGEAGDDNACRPNQLFAISLKHPVLDESRWQAVLDIARERLYTPVGLRSLAPGHLNYQSHYDGDLRSRDAAYHQGTVWGWLIGPFIDSWLKVHPEDRSGARHFLAGFIPHLGEACIGSISEIFDAEEPYSPRGCMAQAWSVAEVLRCWLKTEG